MEPFTVAALKQTSPEQITVILSNDETIKSTLGVVAELRLYSGRELDGEALERLKEASALALCKARALALLSQRPMSAKELRTKLVQKGEDAETALACTRWLEENDLLDDADYAALVARHYAGKGYGAGRVRAELSRRGLSRELWDEAIAAMPSGEKKLDKFIAARLTDPEDRDQVRKLSAALYRRGYSWDEIRAALRRFEAEVEEE